VTKQAALLPEQNNLPDALQLVLAQAPTRRTVGTIAHRTEILAAEMQSGALVDYNGAEVLQAPALVIRSTEPGTEGVAGAA
jgi:hypothetical protein